MPVHWLSGSSPCFLFSSQKQNKSLKLEKRLPVSRGLCFNLSQGQVMQGCAPRGFWDLQEESKGSGRCVSAGLWGRWFTDGSAVTLHVWWGCPHGAPNSRRASSQWAYFHSNSAPAGFSFVFIGARVRYGDPYRAVNGKISALSWHLATHSVSGGPAAPQCGLQSPLRNGPQNLSSLSYPHPQFTPKHTHRPVLLLHLYAFSHSSPQIQLYPSSSGTFYIILTVSTWFNPPWWSPWHSVSSSQIPAVLCGFFSIAIMVSVFSLTSVS